MAKTKTEICNLASSRLGGMGSVENIDNPDKETEVVYSKWYDVSRRTALRQMMPSFAKKREKWAQVSSYVPAFGYKYAYKYSSKCLKLLGIGNLYEKDNNYAVEDGYILTNEYYKDGLPVRYIQDVEDVSKFTDDFVSLFAWFLARDVCLEITDSPEKFSMIENILPLKIAEVCGVDAQENRPIRIERSNLKAARLGLRYNEVKA
jgi:hypothetical protein